MEKISKASELKKEIQEKTSELEKVMESITKDELISLYTGVLAKDTEIKPSQTFILVYYSNENKNNTSNLVVLNSLSLKGLITTLKDNSINACAELYSNNIDDTSIENDIEENNLLLIQKMLYSMKVEYFLNLGTVMLRSSKTDGILNTVGMKYEM